MSRCKDRTAVDNSDKFGGHNAGLVMVGYGAILYKLAVYCKNIGLLWRLWCNMISGCSSNIRYVTLICHFLKHYDFHSLRVFTSCVLLPKCVFATECKTHLLMSWYRYHSIAIPILHQPCPTGSDEISTRLQFSDTQSYTTDASCFSSHHQSHRVYTMYTLW